jgi:copper resistance protein B
VRAWGVGSGLNDIQIGLHLRYEIRRQFAPYVGVEWVRKLGDTADLASRRRRGGERTGAGRWRAAMVLSPPRRTPPP